MRYAIGMRVEAKLDSSATLLWVLAFIVASLLAWWDMASPGVDPANPDDLVWIEVEGQ